MKKRIFKKSARRSIDSEPVIARRRVMRIMAALTVLGLGLGMGVDGPIAANPNNDRAQSDPPTRRMAAGGEPGTDTVKQGEKPDQVRDLRKTPKPPLLNLDTLDDHQDLEDTENMLESPHKPRKHRLPKRKEE